MSDLSTSHETYMKETGYTYFKSSIVELIDYTERIGLYVERNIYLRHTCDLHNIFLTRSRFSRSLAVVLCILLWTRLSFVRRSTIYLATET